MERQNDKGINEKINVGNLLEMDLRDMGSELYFDPMDGNIQQEILRMIVQYLEDIGYHTSKVILCDEAHFQLTQDQLAQVDFERLKSFILEGDWTEVDKLISKPLFKPAQQHKAFIYAIYKQQFLELIEQHELQKAYTLLNKRIKPLETGNCFSISEFKDLCYLLTARSVHDSLRFKQWEGFTLEREKLLAHLTTLSKLDRLDKPTSVNHSLPKSRLLTLINQAIKYQVASCKVNQRPGHNSINQVQVQVDSLLEDYAPELIPNQLIANLGGHEANVKVVHHIPSQPGLVASGSSDTTIKLWDIAAISSNSSSPANVQPIATLRGHTARVWDLASSFNGSLLASASADKTVKLWDVQDTLQCKATLLGHSHDVYSVSCHPTSPHLIASAGYDKQVRLYDINSDTKAPTKTFVGHELAISKVVFNPFGNLLVTGSKDSTVKFHDVTSGLTIKTLSNHLGEVTSVELDPTGIQLLTSSKDNSNRLWDVRMLAKPVQKYQGHQNTSHHFVRAHFAPPNLIYGGSDDGNLFIWDKITASIKATLYRSNGPTFDAVFLPTLSTFVVAGDAEKLTCWGVKD